MESQKLTVSKLGAAAGPGVRTLISKASATAAVFAFAVMGLAGCQPSSAPSVSPTAAPDVQPAPLVQTGQLTWSGEVDDAATVYIQGGKTWLDNVSGKGVDNATSTFNGNLPSSDVVLQLASHAGRGQVQIVQQPTRENNYTAAVLVIDPEAGKSQYTFAVKW